MCTRRQSRTSTNIFVSSHKPTAATSKNTQKKQKTKKKMDKLLQTTHWMRNRSGNLNLPVLKNNEM